MKRIHTRELYIDICTRAHIDRHTHTHTHTYFLLIADVLFNSFNERHFLVILKSVHFWDFLPSDDTWADLTGTELEFTVHRPCACLKTVNSKKKDFYFLSASGSPLPSWSSTRATLNTNTDWEMNRLKAALQMPGVLRNEELGMSWLCALTAQKAVWSAVQGRWFFPFTLPSWDAAWSTAPSSGFHSTRKTWRCLDLEEGH